MNTRIKKSGKDTNTIQTCMAEILFKQCDDASEIVQQLINAEINDDYHDILSILESSKEWKQIAVQCSSNIKCIMDYLHEIKNDELATILNDIDDDKNYLRVLYGNACYIAGIKKGIQLMRFADGTATVNELTL